jgi:thiol-disulfide isomerase/thioredoxin
MPRALFLLILLASAVYSQTRRAPILDTFDAETFGAHQDDGRTIVLQFHSSTCELCVAQEALLNEFAREKDPTTPSFFQADVRANATLATLYGAKPSTLLVFRGKRLLGQKTGISQRREIFEFIKSSVMRSRGRPKPRAKREFKPKR